VSPILIEKILNKIQEVAFRMLKRERSHLPNAHAVLNISGRNLVPQSNRILFGLMIFVHLATFINNTKNLTLEQH